MESIIRQRLHDLNRQFYSEHAADFSATRQRLQPGVLRVVEALQGDETILDLGCGNGGLARTLSRRGHGGSYLGLDFSAALLQEAQRQAFAFPARFLQADLAAPEWPQTVAAGRGFRAADGYDLAFAFAVLHHIPSAQLRLNVLRWIHALLRPQGRFIHSNWQFLTSEKSKSRIQTWDTIGLSSQDLEQNDYLLDWKRGGKGLRYVHHFDEVELAELARASGFEILETFFSDGENRKSSLYQLWKKP